MALVLVYLLTQILRWMQARMDAKDAQLAAAGQKQVEMAESVIRLAETSGAQTAEAMHALTQEIKAMGEATTRMGEAICNRLDKIEGHG